MSRSKILSLALFTAFAGMSQVAFAQTCSTAAWSVTAAGTTAATPPGNGRYSGRCALVTSAAGQTVTDNSPTAETSYRARFYVFTGTLNGDIFRATNAASTEIIGVAYNGTNLNFRVKNGAATGTTSIPAVANRWYGVEVRWSQGAATTFTAIVKGNAATTATTQTIAAVNSTGDVIDTAVLGQITGTGAGRFDEFDSRKTTDIGFLLRGDANGNGTVTITDASVVAAEAGGGALAAGQPDANENGSVTITDAAVIAAGI